MGSQILPTGLSTILQFGTLVLQLTPNQKGFIPKVRDYCVAVKELHLSYRIMDIW